MLHYKDRSSSKVVRLFLLAFSCLKGWMEKRLPSNRPFLPERIQQDIRQPPITPFGRSNPAGRP